MVSLYTVWYNWLRIHKTLPVTPAMAAGLTPSLMSMADVVAMIDADEQKAVADKGRGILAAN
jgi:hypothetical protein